MRAQHEEHEAAHSLALMPGRSRLVAHGFLSTAQLYQPRNESVNPGGHAMASWAPSRSADARAARGAGVATRRAAGALLAWGGETGQHST